MSNQSKAPLRVKGLAAIGELLSRSDAPAAQPPAPKRERRDTADILAKTSEKIHAALIGSTVKGSQLNLLGTYLHAAIRQAYNLGHADALDQNSAVEALLEKQYDSRTKLTTPAVVAAIMEQLGSTELTLDLSMFATVFDRKKIDFSVSDQDVIVYTLIDNGE